MAPKRTNYFRLFVVLAVYFGLFGFLLRKDKEMPVIVGSTLVTIAAIYAILASRKAVAFAAAHPKMLRFSGIAVMILTLLMIPAGIVIFPHMKPDSMWLMGVVLGGIMIGSLLFSMPRSAQYQAKTFSGEIKPEEKSSAGFDSLREAIASIGFVLRRWPAFVSVAGVWVILYAAVPLAVMQYMALRSGLIGHFYDPITTKVNTDVALVGILAWVVIDLIATSIIAVAWHRYVFEGRLPRWGMALPSRGTVFYLFVLWSFSAMIGTFDELIASNGHDLSMLIGPERAKLAVEIAQDLLAMLAIWMFGTFALVLPSSTLKGRRLDIQGAVRAAQTLGRSYPLGLLVAVLPGLAVSFALVKLIDYMLPGSISAHQASLIVPSLFYLVAVTSGATYLSRAYLAADAPGVVPAIPSPTGAD